MPGPYLVVNNDNAALQLNLSDLEFKSITRRAKASNLLTKRQKDVFGLVSLGWDTKSIARQLKIAPGTVKVHLAMIYTLLEVGNKVQLLALLGGTDPTWEPWKQNRRSGEYIASLAPKK